MRIERLQQEFELTLRWTVFPLHPETPAAGQDLADLFAGRMDVAAAMARLKGVAAELELPFGERTRTYNSRLAQELGKWAEEQGQGAAFRAAVYRAYFSAGRNIGLESELLAICAELGLAGAAAERVLQTRSYAAAVDADWERARQLGIQSVPSHLYGNRLLVGFQDYPAFQRLLTV